jgi:hypothetical protein
MLILLLIDLALDNTMDLNLPIILRCMSFDFGFLDILVRIATAFDLHILHLCLSDKIIGEFKSIAKSI